MTETKRRCILLFREQERLLPRSCQSAQLAYTFHNAVKTSRNEV